MSAYASPPELSVLLPFVPRRPEQVHPFSSLVQWTQAARLWQGHGATMDTFGTFAATAGAGFRVPVGVGVTLMPLRHPLDIAHQARSLAKTTQHPVCLGIGPGGRDFQRALLGEPYRSQIGAVGEYVDIVARLLHGETVDATGEYFSCHTALPAEPLPDIEVGLGVLRPAMAQLAGRSADTAITWLTPPSYLDEVIVPGLEAGRAQRTAESTPITATDVPSRPRVVAMVPVALDRPGRDRHDVVVASSGRHMAAPHYRDMLDRAGIAISGTERADTEQLVKGGAFVFGDADEVHEALLDFGRAGVDEVVLNTVGVCAVSGIGAALADLGDILSVPHP
ncbi:MAG: LLM class flavin-dependent oxidoreductase [Corynebacteriales bacterium]|nr:LLM class flavin-dependent oxidoreductase [Mycobacteriales bacterium]